MAHITRLFAVIAGLLLVAGAAVFLFFRSSMASEGLYRVANAVGSMKEFLATEWPSEHRAPIAVSEWESPAHVA